MVRTVSAKAGGEKAEKAQTPARNTAAKDAAAEPFWKKPLMELNRKEWEALCDGCGRCCLVKLEDEDTGKIHFTDIACQLFAAGTCQCGDYPNRKKIIPDCVSLTKANVHTIRWLPPTCAYKLRAEGKDLEWWHYLVSGSRETVHTARISCKGRVGAFEEDIPEDDYPEHIVKWPSLFPKGRPGKK